MVYKYLYQDKSNNNLEGEIKAKNRTDAYTKLRQQGIRPYRVIGDDPINWQPYAIAAGYAVLLAVIIVLVLVKGASEKRSVPEVKPVVALTGDDAAYFRAKAEDAVRHAPEEFRDAVLKSVNNRLIERGLEPLSESNL